MAKLTFMGATRQVTGSCYLLETSVSNILLECGLYQGSSITERQNRQDFTFDIDKIDAVVISHTHLDHCGLLPKLVREGYRGPIYMTTATADLISVMLTDSAHLAMKEAEWGSRAGKRLFKPLYTQKDVEHTLKLREPVQYGGVTRITPDATLTYHDAGHILGSAIVEIRIQETKKSKTLVFSGDLGNSKAALLEDPVTLKQADILLLESTYGDRNHRSMTGTVDEFRQILSDAADSGGNVLIPSFALGRTQEVIFWLGKFYREGSLKQKHVFLDSPMAIAASDIYFKHLELFNEEDAGIFREAVKGNWQEWLPVLKCTQTAEESMAINSIRGGAIIIAGSGMCSGGRIRHHLRNNLRSNKTQVIIVGFQAEGTPGRSLVDGAKSLKIFRDDIAVNATIHTLGGFSAHADQSQLLEWAGNFKQASPELYLIHGELDKMQALQSIFHEQQDWHANIPKPGQIVDF